MRAVMPVGRAGALGLAAILTVLGLSAGPAGSGSARAAVTTDRFNVGAAHSPRLLRQLAGPAGSRRPAGPLVIGGAAQGVDVAAFQHPAGAAINWAQAAAGGIRFAAVKATEGAYYRNPDALTDLAQARAAGLSVVAYAFAIPDGNGGSKSAAVQADYLLSYLGGDARTVPIMLDIEYDPYVSSDKTNQCYGLTPAAMVSWVAAFDAEVQRKTGRLPVVYAPIPWWGTCTGGSAAFRPAPALGPRLHDRGRPGPAGRVG